MSTQTKLVKIVARQPIQHDGEKYAEGDTLSVTAEQAKWLVDVASAAEAELPAKTKAELAAEAKAKAEADAAEKAGAEAKARADADVLAKGNGTTS